MTRKQDNDRLDSFSRAVRDRLAGHELPPDDRAWAELEARLNGKRREAVPLWTWLAGATAVAAAVCLLVLMPPFRPAGVAEPEGVQSVSRETEASVLPPQVQPAAPVVQAVGTREDVEAEPSASVVVPPRHRPVASASQPVQAEVADTPQADEPQSARPSGPTPARPAQPAPERLDGSEAASWDVPPSARSRKRAGGWHVALSVSGGGSKHTEQKNLLAYAPRTSAFLENADEAQQPASGSFSRVTHLPPLSAGLRVRKDLGRHFALETGVTYTYLHSMMADEQIVQREADLQMHYVGIPLNAVAYLVDRPRWSIYCLAGGMVEKGVQATYQETVHTPGLAPTATTETGRIAGLQWSLNASVGIEYRFNRSLSVYLEPNVFYYLKNNQPLSARTENPLIVGLNAGMRITFDN